MTTENEGYVEFKCSWPEHTNVTVRTEHTELEYGELFEMFRTFSLAMGYNPSTVSEYLDLPEPEPKKGKRK
jgi:hypothetical protein